MDGKENDVQVVAEKHKFKGIKKIINKSRHSFLSVFNFKKITEIGGR